MLCFLRTFYVTVHVTLLHICLFNTHYSISLINKGHIIIRGDRGAVFYRQAGVHAKSIYVYRIQLGIADDIEQVARYL